MQKLIKFDKTAQKWFGYVDGEVVVRSKYRDAVETRLGSFSKHPAINDEDFPDQEESQTIPERQFNINELFEFVEQAVTMVSNQTVVSTLLTGDGGIGKTYTVKKTLGQLGREDVTLLPEAKESDDEDDEDSDEEEVIEVRKIDPEKSYIMIKGYSTAKGLYRSLYRHNGKLIILDDCDRIFKDETASNILKGALDSYDQRIISWNAEIPEGDDLPRTFEFTGQVIFISNLDQSKIPQSLRTRTIAINLSMTEDQKIERMAHIVKSPEYLPEHKLNHKLEALELIKELKHEAREISLRTLQQIIKVRSEGKENWKQFATYLLVQG